MISYGTGTNIIRTKHFKYPTAKEQLYESDESFKTFTDESILGAV